MDIAKLSAHKMLELIKKRDLSPVDLAKTCLDVYNKQNPKLNAVCSLSDEIMATAEKLEKQAEKGEFLPLHGLPVGIKDVTPTANLRTTYGSPLYKDNVPKEDALVVQRLKENGAIIFGKTNTPEFATGGNTFNEVFGTTRNPWNTDLSAGGSTGGGAAALASGMIALAEGTDLGGSLRIPASFCGIVGLRPTPGLIPTYPSEYLWDDMQVTGPMARTAEDIALMLDAVAGASPLSPMRQPIAGRNFLQTVLDGIPAGTKVAYCSDIAGIGSDPEVEKICRNAAFLLKEKGINVTEIDFDLSFGRKPFLHLRGEWMLIQQYKNLERRNSFGSNLAGNIEAGLKITTKELAEAQHGRAQIWFKFRELFNKYDYFLTPCMVVPPFPAEQNYPLTIAGKEMKTYIDWVAPTFILSLTSLPVGSVPCGLTEKNLPVGMQIVGKPTSEEHVLALAKIMQELIPIGLPTL